MMFVALRVMVAVLLSVSVLSQAQEVNDSGRYPQRPVRLVVPYAPGGSSDVIGRIIGQKLGESLGQTFVVDNRGGAGSMLGTDIVAKSAPDGYTLVLSDTPHTINPSIYAKVPYDPLNDFAPITLVGVSPMFLFVHPAFAPRSVADLVALAKREPGKIAIGSGGNGATTHLLAELLQARTGIRLTHVPYKGAGPALADVVAGQIPVMFTAMATAAPFVKSGRLRVLGVTSAKRNPALPDVPTFEESGISGMAVEQWWGVMAPARVPRSVIDKLHGAIASAVGSPDVRERFATLAVEPTTTTPAGFRALLDADLKRWAKVVKDAGIQPN